MSEPIAVRPIRTEQDYENALGEIGQLMTSRAGTADGDRLDILSTLVEAYEAQHHVIDAPDPIALVQFAIEQRGLKRTALEPMIGTRGRVSEVLTRQRSLSLTMIRKLKVGLDLPADALVRSYPLRVRRKASGPASGVRRKLVA